MKASLQFREEKNPLLRAKLPFTAGALSLSSGIAVGNSQELAIHLGTFFSAGPAIKLAFKPNDPSPLSVVLKAGLGRWGSPISAPITLKAELYVAPRIGDPIFTLRIKPRAGDFSFQKDVNAVGFARTQQKEAALAPLQSTTSAEKLAISTPPPASGDLKSTPKRNSGNFGDKDRMRSPSIDSNAVVIGSNFSLKIEGLDREWKGRSDRKPKAEGAKEQESEGEFTMLGNGNGVHTPTKEAADEQVKPGEKGMSLRRALALAGAHSSLQGCRIIARSSLPMGKQARLNVQWGVKPSLDILQGWDGSLRSLQLSKLPSLLLNKISFEQVSVPVEKRNAAALQSGHREGGGFLPASFLEENRELAQVASLCYNMKRQLHLLYAENQVLRRSMEDMKSQVDLRGLKSSTSGPEDGVFPKEQVFSRAMPNLDSPQALFNGREEVEDRKAHKNTSRKDGDVDMKPTPSLGSANADMSKEFEKAIKSAKSTPSGGRRD